jgi:hypothetical protein
MDVEAVCTVVWCLQINVREDYYFMINWCRGNTKTICDIQTLQYVYESLKKCNQHQL